MESRSFLKTEDFEKVEKPVTENVVDLGPVPPTTVNDDNGSDMMLALEAQKDYLTSTRLLSMFYMSTP